MFVKVLLNRIKWIIYIISLHIQLHLTLDLDFSFPFFDPISIKIQLKSQEFPIYRCTESLLTAE